MGLCSCINKLSFRHNNKSFPAPPITRKGSITIVAVRCGLNLPYYYYMLPLNARSLLINTFMCSNCNSAYVGETKRHFLVRMFAHLGISQGNNYTYNHKYNNNTAVLNHIHCNNYCNATLDNFRVIGGARNDFLLCLKESLLMGVSKKTNDPQ